MFSYECGVAIVDNSTRVIRLYPVIINSTGTETFAKEHMLKILLCTIKKVRWFFSHVSNKKFAEFCVLCFEMICKWVLFPYAL